MATGSWRAYFHPSTRGMPVGPRRRQPGTDLSAGSERRVHDRPIPRLENVRRVLACERSRGPLLLSNAALPGSRCRSVARTTLPLPLRCPNPLKTRGNCCYYCPTCSSSSVYAVIRMVAPVIRKNNSRATWTPFGTSRLFAIEVVCDGPPCSGRQLARQWQPERKSQCPTGNTVSTATRTVAKSRNHGPQVVPATSPLSKTLSVRGRCRCRASALSHV